MASKINKKQMTNYESKFTVDLTFTWEANFTYKLNGAIKSLKHEKLKIRLIQFGPREEGFKVLQIDPLQ